MSMLLLHHLPHSLHQAPKQVHLEEKRAAACLPVSECSLTPPSSRRRESTRPASRAWGTASLRRRCLKKKRLESKKVPKLLPAAMSAAASTFQPNCLPAAESDVRDTTTTADAADADAELRFRLMPSSPSEAVAASSTSLSSSSSSLSSSGPLEALLLGGGPKITSELRAERERSPSDEQQLLQQDERSGRRAAFSSSEATAPHCQSRSPSGRAWCTAGSSSTAVPVSSSTVAVTATAAATARAPVTSSSSSSVPFSRGATAKHAASLTTCVISPSRLFLDLQLPFWMPPSPSPPPPQSSQSSTASSSMPGQQASSSPCSPPRGRFLQSLLFASERRFLVFLIFFATFLHQTVSVVESAKAGGFRCGAGSADLLACLPEDYSKFELPVKNGVNAILVTIDIDEVLRINDKDYSITFATYFNVKWPDKRIRLDPEFGREQVEPGANVTDDIMVPTNLEFVKDLWLPNIFIYNLKTYKVIDVLSKLAGLWIGADRTVFYSQATHITFICPMRFDKFPLDTQTCKFQVGSYSYDDTRMVFVTESAGYSSKTANSIALDYAITINDLKPEDQVFLGGPLGNFSLAGFEMVLHRYVSTYIITYYLPSGLFVIVSWISFLIPMDVIPGRMALLVTLFLVLVNIFNTVTTNTPKAEGLTAIEAWMLACILFVFGALIEYAAILFKKQRFVSTQHHMNIKIVCKENFKYEVQAPPPSAPSSVNLQQLAEEYWRIDKFFLISFPILFFIFNIIYWLAFIL